MIGSDGRDNLSQKISYVGRSTLLDVGGIEFSRYSWHGLLCSYLLEPACLALPPNHDNLEPGL